jgi:hypothetical protein
MMSGSRSRNYVLLLALLCAPRIPARAQTLQEDRSNATLNNYRKHLENLEVLVDRCRAQRTTAACDPSQVGGDDRVDRAAGGATDQREIRYDWLRSLLFRAGRKEEPPKPSLAPAPTIKTTPPTVDALLAQAQQRLKHDWLEAGEPVPADANYAAERKSLAAILARKEYQGVSEISTRERLREWLENWLVNLFNRLVRFGYRSPWIAFTLRALLLGTLGTALIWAFIRIERRSRAQLASGAPPAGNAPSARGWQLWLEDARNMAAQSRWREAIHFLYWASISRLESKRLWPADCARTPREYLLLLPAADPRKMNLTALTRSFERTWYGGREAHPSDFQAALQMAAELGVE